VDGFLTARQYGKVQKIAANSINRRHFEQLPRCAKLLIFWLSRRFCAFFACPPFSLKELAHACPS